MALRALQGPTGGGSPVGGTGTTNTIPRWTGPSTLGDSIITQTGSTRITVGSGAYAGASVDGFRVANGTDSYITASDGTRTLLMGANGAQVLIGSLTNHSLVVKTNNIDAMTILPGAAGVGGNVGIGTASPNAILSVYNAGTPTISLWNSSNYSRLATNTNDLYIDAGLGGAAGAVIFRRGSGTVDSARIDSSGNFCIGTAAAATASSRLTVAGGFIATAAGYGVYQPGDHLTLSGGAGKNVHLKPNDGGVLAVNVGATSCDMSAVSGYGLKLPATPGNTDPNTLDCYADGGTANSGGVTWTPTLAFGGNSTGITYTTQVGRYTRIGNTIVAHGYIKISSKGTSTGDATIGGLPTSSNTTGVYPAAAIGFTANISFAAQMFARMNPNSTSVFLTETTAGGAVSALNDTDFNNSSEIAFTICYPVT